MKLPRAQTTSPRLGPQLGNSIPLQDIATAIHFFTPGYPQCSYQKGTPKVFLGIPNNSEIKTTYSSSTCLPTTQSEGQQKHTSNAFLSTALTHHSGRKKKEKNKPTQMLRSYKMPERQGVGELEKPRVYTLALNAPIWLPRAC